MFKSEQNPLLLLENVEKVCFVSSENYEIENVERVESGDKFYYFCPLSVAKTNFQKLSQNCSGIQVYLPASEYQNVCKKLHFQLIKQEKYNEMLLFYGYSASQKQNVIIDGRNCNIQIAIDKDNMIVGTPIILTGY